MQAHAISLVYVSRSRIDDADRQVMLDDLMVASLTRNSMLDITGVLIATPRHFAQVLEGPAVSVDAVMASITADPRHHDLRLVRRIPISVSRFPNWRMVRFNSENFGADRIEAIIAARNEPVTASARRMLDRLFASAVV
jgi:hypothetical protein